MLLTPIVSHFFQEFSSNWFSGFLVTLILWNPNNSRIDSSLVLKYVKYENYSGLISIKFLKIKTWDLSTSKTVVEMSVEK